MNVTVYLSAQAGNDTSIRDDIISFGRFLGEKGHCLVYGGSRSGLMGVIADSALEAGGKVIGVEPRFFVEAEFQHDGITELIVTETMNERKEKLMELSDVIVAFPGSTGTLEEIADAASAIKMGMLDRKLIIYDHKGFYRPLRELFSGMVKRDYIKDSELSNIIFASDLEELELLLENA